MSRTDLRVWRDLFPHTVSVAPQTGKDQFGKPTYGTDVSYRARVVGKRRQVINAVGQAVLSDQTVYLYTADVVAPSSRVTLSTGYVGSTAALAINPPILSVARMPDESGFHHTVLYLAALLAVALQAVA